ncbi:MAG: hypothetical protein K0Q72_2637 [Armatimonadetes bacterium]|jgi:hypothetical protein|nr:hypothetical protein [Armatimonadota bacterium]
MMAGQRLRRPETPVVALAALLLVLGSGCGRKAAPPAASVPAVAAPTPGYLDVERLLRVHPDLSKLRELERRMTQTTRAHRPLGSHTLRAPEPVALATPAPAETLPAAPAGVDKAGAIAAIREDFAIRRAARPEREEEAYRRALGRLRRRFLEFRREPLPVDADKDLALAVKNARRFSELQEQLRSLRERPEDRFFYTPAQLRRRRELFHLTEQEVEALRLEEVARLENALEARGPLRNAEGTEREIPAAEIEKAERERDQLRREALEELARLERQEIARVNELVLPAPAIEGVRPDPSLTADGDIESERTRFEARVRESAQPPTVPNAPDPVPGTVAALRQERDELRLRMTEEVRAAAAAAARARGIRSIFKRGAAPDRTRDIEPAVARLLAGTAPQGERIHERKR